MLPASWASFHRGGGNCVAVGRGVLDLRRFQHFFRERCFLIGCFRRYARFGRESLTSCMASLGWLPQRTQRILFHQCRAGDCVVASSVWLELSCVAATVEFCETEFAAELFGAVGAGAFGVPVLPGVWRLGVRADCRHCCCRYESAGRWRWEKSSPGVCPMATHAANPATITATAIPTRIWISCIVPTTMP